jgi:mRNA-degrading endonuclease RelE of RelBE toxin-antitoxin system
MDYNIIVSPRAQKEVEQAIDSYISNYDDVPNNFIKQLQKVYDILKINPFFRIRHKNVRSLKIKKYPYSIYFSINESRNTVSVLSCFHNKRDPQKRPSI